jgi:uncharacterized membrane protein YccC
MEGAQSCASRGETLVRGFRRFMGAMIGIVIGLLIAVLLGRAGALTAALIAVSVCGISIRLPQRLPSPEGSLLG